MTPKHMMELHAQGLGVSTQEAHQFAPSCKLAVSTSISKRFSTIYTATLKPIRKRKEQGQQNILGKEKKSDTTEINTSTC